MRSRISVCFPQFYGVTGRPPCFSAHPPPPRSLVLNFLRCDCATSETAISISTIFFLLHAPILRIFYRRPLHLYNPAVPFFRPYRSFFFPSRSPYPSHLFLFHSQRLTPSASQLPCSVLFAILSILFAAHLYAWRTTWDKKGIHGRATRRTPETQIYFFNIVNITMPKKCIRQSIPILWRHSWLSNMCQKSNRFLRKIYLFRIKFLLFTLFLIS